MRTFLVISFWGYPFGGGEEYLYQTAIWARKHGMNSYWLCFSNADNKAYNELSIEYIDCFTIIKVPDGFNITTLYNWVKLINPDIVHHQGHMRKEIHDVCASLRIHMITGIHFWSGVLILNESCSNVNIYQNYEKHKTHPDFLELYNSKFCTFYSVSKFVSECVKKITDKEIEYLSYSGSTKSKYFVENNDPVKNRYVTIINIHKMKGGELLLFLLQELKKIPFLIVRTEYQSEQLDKQIEDLVKTRNMDGSSAKSLFLNRTNDVKSLYSQTKIFLAPSIVDETFCRTVNEAMMNGIPVITTGQGNIKYLVENAGIILPLTIDSITNSINKTDMIKWKNAINELYNNKTKMKEISIATRIKYNEYSENVCETMFMKVVTDSIVKSKEYNIMIIAPWCDQGLGIQSRNYYRILNSAKYNVHVFSLKPYIANSAIELQKDPNEWIVDRIYYSPNDREHVKDTELLEFVRNYNIGKCIIPETCWFRVFEIAKLLRDNNVKAYAVPNIEIVRKDEIVKHKYFYKILCNNTLCYDIFGKHGITNIKYIGYGLSDRYVKFKDKDDIDGNFLKFLFIGGMNAFSRKHILEICEGFTRAYEKNTQIRMTCTVQKINLLEMDDINSLSKYINHPGIDFVQNHLKYNDIINMYYNHHVSIQVSKHEGLGLGFYESLATGTPILSLDTPPHNEIVKNGINGWLIPCHYKKMTDNPNSFIESAYFDPNILCNKILEIYNNKDTLPSLCETLHNDYINRLSIDIFETQFINSLN